MIIEKKFKVRRTPFDIPIALFLLSQIISTFISLDPHVSFWGYYSRFNGGLLSLLTYFFLYYAFVTHFTKDQIITLIKWILISGFLVAIWGLPSHFGKDPTCFVFRGTFDVSCWTEAFKPTIRMFATLGQPAWLAAFMACLLPLCLTTFLKSSSSLLSKSENRRSKIEHSFFNLPSILYLLSSVLFYICLLYANTRAGFIGFWIGNLTFWSIISLHKSKKTLWFSLYALSNVLLIVFAVYKSADLLFWFIGVIAFLLVLLYYSKSYRLHILFVHILLLVATFFNATPLENVN
jgi:hypothetical protein